MTMACQRPGWISTGDCALLRSVTRTAGIPCHPSPSISTPPAKVIAPTNTPHTIPVRFGCALRVPDFPLEAEREFDREFNFVWGFRAKARFLRMQSEGWGR